MPYPTPVWQELENMYTLFVWRTRGLVRRANTQQRNPAKTTQQQEIWQSGYCNCAAGFS
ncbi:hypothetical protein K0M31_008431 [Melipona bicolor]|uniref:Uncharacterized protein n=1 Tax=Melipona bicolor TaxID=60889 RepID=A0AA40FRP1_9HYME|nr:hypothetical protein K0M31_008431 [Melipona bicolor]